MSDRVATPVTRPATFDGPEPYAPALPGPPPDYAPPFEGRVPRTHKRCVDCRRVAARDSSAFGLKWAGDPYGIFDREKRQLRRSLGRKLTAKELVQCRSTVDGHEPQPGALLHVQSICRACHKRRRHRLGAISRLEDSAAQRGVTVERGEFYHTATMAHPPRDRETLESLATAGVVLLGSGGEPVLPVASGEALRVCYAALLSPQRVGALGTDRAALLQRVPDLAMAAEPKHPMAKRAEDVRDVVLVRERGACADAAMDRLISRLWLLRQRKAQAMIKSGALDRFEAPTRLLEGIHDAVASWDPLHHSAAILKTHAFNRIGRALQLRGRKDYAIAAQKGDDGKWYGGAASIDRMVGGDGEETLVPWAVNYTAAHQAAVRVCAERRNGSVIGAAQHDVSVALSALAPVDREIAFRLWMSSEKVTLRQVADEVEMDVRDVRARSKQVRALLAVLLADYDKEVV